MFQSIHNPGRQLRNSHTQIKWVSQIVDHDHLDTSTWYMILQGWGHAPKSLLVLSDHMNKNISSGNHRWILKHKLQLEYRRLKASYLTAAIHGWSRLITLQCQYNIVLHMAKITAINWYRNLYTPMIYSDLMFSVPFSGWLRVLAEEGFG